MGNTKSTSELPMDMLDIDKQLCHACLGEVNATTYNTVKELIRKGADVNVRFEFHFTDLSPLLLACQRLNLRLVRLLLDSGATDERALDFVVALRFRGGDWSLWPEPQELEVRLEMINLLIDRGYDVNFRRGSKEVPKSSPLCFAAGVGCLETAKLLIERGALADGDCILSIWHSALETEAAMAELFLQNGADPNTSQNNGVTLLIRAISWGGLPGNDGSRFVDLVKVMLKYGADPDLCDDEGRSPLILACELGLTEIVEVLLDHQKQYLPNYDNKDTDELKDEEDEDNEEEEDEDDEEEEYDGNDEEDEDDDNDEEDEDDDNDEEDEDATDNSEDVKGDKHDKEEIEDEDNSGNNEDGKEKSEDDKNNKN